MAKKLIFLALGFFLVTSLSGQSWKKLRKLADEQFAVGNYEEAARNYEAAWEKKPKKEDLIFNAGEAYFLIRDYRNAAAAYENIRNNYDDYPLAGLKYARCLKQDGQYDKSIQAFREFGQGYTGQSKAILEEIIRTEIRGAELAKQLSGQMNTDIKVEHLGLGVNSDANEFSPLSFSNDVLYFSSNMGGRARIYRSQRVGGRWDKASIPENFPVIQDDHFAHGTLTPDGSRFYFTICGSGSGFNNLSTRCEIYVIKRISGTWSPPERLPNTINVDGTTSTQPFVVHQGGTEFLYFASNRGGGRGGLDLWYATRNLGTDNLDFGNPVNLGPTINTLGDEMAPFINVQTGWLYFSSNGHVTTGGFDIFRSQGATTSWSVPENLGLPFNSSADDFYYVEKDDQSGGFFASNRIFAGSKITTTDDDIFEFSKGGSFRPVLQASVFDQTTNDLIQNFTVSVFEIGSNGLETPLYSRPFSGGNYLFDLPPGGTYRVEISSPNYETQSYTVMAGDPGVTNYGQSVFLVPSMPSQPIVPPVTPPVTTMPVETTPTVNPAGRQVLFSGGEMYTSRGMAPGDEFEFMTNAPRYAGTYYKVQLVALTRYNPNSNKFNSVLPLGEELTVEYVAEKDLNRILLGCYFSEMEARSALQQVHANGFPKAFLIRYVDGQRYGRVNL